MNRKDSSNSKLNVLLMRRVAEVLHSYKADEFRAIDVTARGKVVTLKGRIVGDDNRKLALELARTTVGVEGVVDRLAVVVKARKAPVVETLVAPPKKDSALTRGLVFVSLLGVISSSVLSMVKKPQSEYLDSSTSISAPLSMQGIYPVEGMLFVEGKPATGAEVVFHPVADFNEASCRAIAVVDADGRFRLKTLDHRSGAPAGKFVVTVTWYKPIPPGEDISPQEAGSLVPKRFEKPQTTPLRVDIRPNQVAGAEETAVVRLPPLHVTQNPTVRRI